MALPPPMRMTSSEAEAHHRWVTSDISYDPRAVDVILVYTLLEAELDALLDRMQAVRKTREKDSFFHKAKALHKQWKDDPDRGKRIFECLMALNMARTWAAHPEKGPLDAKVEDLVQAFKEIDPQTGDDYEYSLEEIGMRLMIVLAQSHGGLPPDFERFPRYPWLRKSEAAGNGS